MAVHLDLLYVDNKCSGWLSIRSELEEYRYKTSNLCKIVNIFQASLAAALCS